MDVAPWTANVQVSMIFFRLAVFGLVFCAATSALALNERQPIHYSGDRQVWDRNSDKVELFGHASMHQPGEVLTADYILLDQKKRTLDARGNCVYITGNTVLNGEEMHFNLDSRTGSVNRGRVAGENFTLGGERINKLGPDRYQTHWGEYSTCRDCPQSWTFMAQDVDLEVGGYAYMNNVTVKIKDTPSFWFPYLVVPIKTQRQTGFLFPKFIISDADGLYIVEPFFWAIGRSTDMTFGLGRWASRGVRGEWETRHLSENGSFTSNFGYLNDTFGPLKPKYEAGESVTEAKDRLNPAGVRNRWAFVATQQHKLPFGISEKLKLREVSDNFYPSAAPADGVSPAEATAASILSFSRPGPELSAYIAAKRYRQLVVADPDPTIRQTQFDPRTVQVLPTAVVTTNDRPLPVVPFNAGISFGATNFTRSAGSFDRDSSQHVDNSELKPLIDPTKDFEPGVDPLRKATRASVLPTLYTSFRPLDVLEVTPSARYFQYFYDFHGAAPDLYRGYLLAQVELSTQFERIYELSDADIPRMKHLIRPSLTYSRIPFFREDKQHPFMRQMARREGYNFDTEDIVPLTVDPSKASSRNYFYPQGNSISYGLTTQLIRRRAPLKVDYAYHQPFAEVRAGQTLNLKEYQTPSNLDLGPRPMSRFFSNLSLDLDKITHRTDYYYYPYIGGTRHELTSSLSVIFQRATRFHVYTFDRSFSVRYAWNEVGCVPNPNNERVPLCTNGNAAVDSLVPSINFSLNDYLLPTVTAEYDMNQKAWLNYTASIAYQSPAQCWKFTLAVNFRRLAEGSITEYKPDLALNISGQGFGGVMEVYERGVTTSK